MKQEVGKRTSKPERVWGRGTRGDVPREPRGQLYRVRPLRQKKSYLQRSLSGWRRHQLIRQLDYPAESRRLPLPAARKSDLFLHSAFAVPEKLRGFASVATCTHMGVKIRSVTVMRKRRESASGWPQRSVLSCGCAPQSHRRSPS